MGDKKSSLFDEIKEEHLDMMIRFALKQEDIERLLDNYEEEDNISEEKAKRTYELALKKYSMQIEQKVKEKRRQKCQYVIRSGTRFLICMILILAIAVPIAFASIPALRQYVTRMLINIEEDHTEIQLEVVDNDLIPAEWTGSYYPSYIPMRYELLTVDRFDSMAVYEDTNGNTIYYSESKNDEQINVDSEGAEIVFEPINGSIALIFKEGDIIRIVWNNDDRLFMITGTLSIDEARLMAKSVKRIAK